MNDYLSSTGRYIYITPNFKIINPEHLGVIYRYCGSIDGYDFKNQSKNLKNIQNILNKKGKQLIYVYVGKFYDNKNEVKISFVAHNEDCSFWWRKYEGLYSANEVYEDGKKYKLSQWLKNNICSNC